MRKSFIFGIAISLAIPFSGSAQNQYLGVESCIPCHSLATQGPMYDVWQKSKHAGAFQILKIKSESEARDLGDLKLWIVEIGRGVKYGLPKPAVESPECLPCHTASFGIEAKLIASPFDPKDGVQCEACHGPGSDHVKAKTLFGGRGTTTTLRQYEDEHAIKALCTTCHDGTCGDFDFDKMWPKIKHSVPKAH